MPIRNKLDEMYVHHQTRKVKQQDIIAMTVGEWVRTTCWYPRDATIEGDHMYRSRTTAVTDGPGTGTECEASPGTGVIAFSLTV